MKKSVKLESAEFDQFADEYYVSHTKNIAVTGEKPEYFAEYKISALRRYAPAPVNGPLEILDFGSGIGNSIPYYRTYFPDAKLHCLDVSERSLDISRERFPGDENYVLIGEDRIEMPEGQHDLVFSACVFHHIDHAQHRHWMAELLRLCRPGAKLVIFEHNPLNPLTLNAVNTCPFDVNARLIRAGELQKTAEAAGWSDIKIDYHVFFPNALRALRRFEKHLEWLPLGAQYSLVATKR